VTQDPSTHFNGLSNGHVTKVGQSDYYALHTPEPHLYGKFLGHPTNY